MKPFLKQFFFKGEHIFDLSCTVKLVCNNSTCSQSRFMHRACFDHWESKLVALYCKKEGGRKSRNWTEKQKAASVWKQQGYSLVAELCACKCGSGSLRKDLNWVPPKPHGSGPNSDSEKHKRRRKKNNKHSKPALTIGLPNFSAGQPGVKRSDCQGIPASRQRTNSMSSSNSGSSSYGSSADSPATSPPHEPKLPPRQANMRDRSR